MGFSFLPPVKRCCFCTKKLRVACILIVIWSMLVSAHAIAITFVPSCDNNYKSESTVLTVFKWLLYTIYCIVILSSFAFLLTLCLQRFSVTADLFMVCGFISAIVSICYAIVSLVEMVKTKCPFNPSDAVALLIYSALWAYFILIVNTFSAYNEDTPPVTVE